MEDNEIQKIFERLGEIVEMGELRGFRREEIIQLILKGVIKL